MLLLDGASVVSVGGPEYLTVGEDGGYECVSSDSNPPSQIYWQVTDSKGEDVMDTIQVVIVIVTISLLLFSDF